MIFVFVDWGTTTTFELNYTFGARKFELKCFFFPFISCFCDSWQRFESSLQCHPLGRREIEEKCRGKSI